MIVTPDAIQTVLDAHPPLNVDGYGIPRLRRFTREVSAEGRSLTSRRSVEEIQASADWLATLTPRKTATDGPSSYGLKHVMERATGIYVTNGAFITAALLLDLPVLLDDLNPAIGVTRRSVEAALKTNH